MTATQFLFWTVRVAAVLACAWIILSTTTA